MSRVPGLLDAAREYCEHGEPVFWIGGKQPLGGRGHLDATDDYAELRAAYSPRATGLGWPVPSGCFVLDVDPRHGGDDSLRALEAEHGELPSTMEQITGSGGRHLVFATDVEIRQCAGFRPGLDTRAAGRGYIVVAPSLHPETGKPYYWVRRCEPVAAPGWLIAMVRVREVERRPYTPPIMPSSSPSRHRAWAISGLRREAATIAAMAPNSGRNDALNRAAFRFGKMIAGGLLTVGEVRDCLRAAGIASGLPEREVDKVLRV